MARIVVRRRKDGRAKGVRVKSSGQHCRIQIASAKAARVKKPSKRRPE